MNKPHLTGEKYLLQEAARHLEMLELILTSLKRQSARKAVRDQVKLLLILSARGSRLANQPRSGKSVPSPTPPTKMKRKELRKNNGKRS